MRILYVINAFSWGGAEKLVYDLALCIRPQIDSVCVAALYKQNNATEQKMINDLNEHGIQTFILNKTAGKDRLASIWRLHTFAKEQGITIIHAHCSVPMLIGKTVGQMLRIPVICTIHNTRGYSAKREIITMWMASKYISIGRAAEEYMIKELKIPPKKIERIYNAIDTSKFKQREKTPHFWSRYQGVSGEISILNVARVNEQKNQLCILRAAKKCMESGVNVHVYILGGYDEQGATYKKLDAYINQEGLKNSVTFLGMHNDTSSFLNNADCFVMTSWFEGLSVAFLEAVVSGTPIITTDMPFVEELMEIGNCATVIKQDDDNSLAEIIIGGRYYSPDKDVIETFKNRFSMEEFCGHHLMIYRSFI